MLQQTGPDEIRTLPLLLNPQRVWPNETELLQEFVPEKVNPRWYRSAWVPPLQALKNSPTVEQHAVDTLFQVLRDKAVRGQDLAKATLVLHHHGFGMMVHKHPRPGIVHVFNKKFGDRPLEAPPTIDLGPRTWDGEALAVAELKDPTEELKVKIQEVQTDGTV